MKPPVDPPREIQSAAEVPLCGRDDPAVKEEVYSGFILEFGREYDAKQAGKGGGPYVDWQKPDHHYLNIPDEEWTYASHVLLDAYDWMTGRVKTPADATDTDSARAGLSPGVRTNSTLPTALAIYNYAARRLKGKLDDADLHKLEILMDQSDHPCTLPDIGRPDVTR